LSLCLSLSLNSLMNPVELVCPQTCNSSWLDPSIVGVFPNIDGFNSTCFSPLSYSRSQAGKLSYSNEVRAIPLCILFSSTVPKYIYISVGCVNQGWEVIDGMERAQIKKSFDGLSLAR
jgi:hypothetical protein